MPLFKRKGKIPARNIEAGASTISVKDLDEPGGESGAIKLQLGDSKLVFEDGVWTSGVVTFYIRILYVQILDLKLVSMFKVVKFFKAVETRIIIRFGGTVKHVEITLQNCLLY